MGLNFKQQDKIMHIIFAMLCAFICSALIAHTTTTPLPAILGGWLCGVVGGLGKEYGDFKNPNNTWSWSDVLANIIGATIGCMGGFLTYAIHI